MMPRSPLSRSPLSRSPLSRSPNAVNATTTIKFCHYKNSMFMGHMRCFEREGKGILLLDSGECAIATYHKDKLHGQTTVITPKNQIYSLTMNHNVLVEMVAKDQHKMLWMKFKHEMPSDQATLIDYKTQEITYVVYRQGKIVGKYNEQDSTLINRVFEHQNLSTLIPIHHLRALNFELKAPHMEVIKRHTTITIGYHKGGFLNGLGVILLKDTDKDDGSYSLLEKGYYKDSQLDGVGEKRFQNGNLYIGEFKGNTFQGRGLLFNSQRQNWVKGIFKGGNMVDMVEYSNEGESKDPKVMELLGALHKKKSSWINSDVRLHREIDFNLALEREFSRIQQHSMGGELDFQQRKEVVLRRIQENFVPDAGIDFSGTLRSNLSPNPISFDPKAPTTKKSINSFDNSHDSRNRMKLSPVRVPKRVIEERSKDILPETKSPDRKSHRNKLFSPSNTLFTPSERPSQQVSESWKNSTSKAPVNIYTFEEEQIQESPNKLGSFAESHQNIHKMAKSGQQRNLPKENSSPASRVSGSRRNRIFEMSHSRDNSSSRMGQPSPSKSSIRETNRNVEDSSVTSVFQEIGRFSNRSRKMVRSRIFEEEEAEEDEQLPTFRYSRFRTEEEIQGTSAKKSRIF